MAKKSEYVSKAITTKIQFTSRASVKIRDNYYTVEACEERMIPQDISDIDMDAERALLWDCVNTECDKQIDDIIQMFKQKLKQNA